MWAPEQTWTQCQILTSGPIVTSSSMMAEGWHEDVASIMNYKTDVEQGKSSKYDELEINSIIRTGLSKKEFEVIKFIALLIA